MSKKDGTYTWRGPIKKHFHFLRIRKYICEKYGHSSKVLHGNTGDFCDRCGARQS